MLLTRLFLPICSSIFVLAHSDVSFHARHSPRSLDGPLPPSHFNPVHFAPIPPATVERTPHKKAARSFGSSSLVPRSSRKHKGLDGVSDKHCGRSGATNRTSITSGPNGSEKWLNCGLSRSHKSSRWTPPTIHLSELSTISLSQALSETNSPYRNCRKYVKYFDRYGKKYGLPPILLAAFAMQESSCNSNTRGDAGGAFGLMQITKDKCGGRGANECSDPAYNIQTAAEYFARTLKEQNKNFLLALGAYDGWYKGLTYHQATKAAHSGCCECQQNLDYLPAMLNGWLLGLDGSNLGTYKNLDVCRS